MKFEVVILANEHYGHHLCFFEVGKVVTASLRELGHAVEFRIGRPSRQSGVTAVLLGHHLAKTFGVELLPSDILYNFEQVGSGWWPAARENILVKKDLRRVWEYSGENSRMYGLIWPSERGARDDLQLVPLGFHAEFRFAEPKKSPKWPVVFVGSVNERRQVIFDALKALGVSMLSVTGGVYGAHRDEIYRETGFVLNVHFYETKIFEQVRVAPLLANAVPVLSEQSAGIEAQAWGVTCRPYEGLVETVEAMVASPRLRVDVAEVAHEKFLKTSMKRNLERALEKTFETSLNA